MDSLLPGFVAQRPSQPSCPSGPQMPVSAAGEGPAPGQRGWLRQCPRDAYVARCRPRSRGPSHAAAAPTTGNRGKGLGVAPPSGSGPCGGFMGRRSEGKAIQPSPREARDFPEPRQVVWRAISAADLLVALGTGAVCVTRLREPGGRQGQQLLIN